MEERLLIFICAIIISSCLWFGVNYKGSELGRKITKSLKKLEERLNDTGRPR